ncbi:MAG: phage protein Gp13 family protein, partial [Alphaproteobacteria bacterium]
GLCWFLTSKLVAGFTKEERWSFRMMLRRNLIETLKVHHTLFNVVWNQNEDHLRLIKSMGARIGDSEYGFTSFSFHREDFSEFQH